MKDNKEMYVYCVVYSNYYPSEIDSIWTTRERAQEECDRLNSTITHNPFQVEKWEVYQ